MARKPWNDFVKAHPTAPAFSTQVTATFKNGPYFDKSGQKLPTPYALFQEWLRKNMQGDWSTVHSKGAFAVRVAEEADAKLITQKYPAVGPARKSDVSPSTTQISFVDASYGALATELGYQFLRKNP
jgi:hypothetical protein